MPNRIFNPDDRNRRLRFEPLEDRRMLSAVAHGGDYNLDLSVDAADYVFWRKAAGQAVERYSGADGDGSGIVDVGDFNGWRGNFGRTGPPQPIIGFVEFEAQSGTQLILEIVGSDLGDSLTIGSGATPQDIEITYQNSAGADVDVTVSSATINAKVLETGLAFRGVYVRGLAGSDTIDLGDLDVRAIVEAGNGGDDVTGGSQPDLILGGRGADTIAGGDGRDLLVGGRDGDSIGGDAGDDIVIGGEPTVSVAALDGALALWDGPGNYNHRRNDVLEVLIANENVIEDQVVDTLTGGTNRDLFFAADDTPSNNDVVTDFDPPQEHLQVTHPPIPASQLFSEPLGLVYTFNDASIDYIRIAVSPSLWSGSTPGAITVEIRLVELFGDGTAEHLLTLSLLLSLATLVSPNGGPGGTAVFDIDITTRELEGIAVNACTRLHGPGVLDGDPESVEETCVVLEPVEPF